MKRCFALALVLVLAMCGGAAADGYTFGLTCFQGTGTDRTSEAKQAFPTCVKALEVTAAPSILIDGIEFFPQVWVSDPSDTYDVKVYAKNTSNAFILVREATGQLSNYVFDVIRNSTFDLVQGDDNVTGYVVLCVGEAAPTSTPTATPTTKPAQYAVAGTWQYTGTGSINGYGASDIGTATITATGSAGSETITNIAMSGTMRNTTTGQSAPYSFSVQTSTPFTGTFSVTYDGVTETFTQTGGNTMTVTARGKQTSTGYNVSFNYDATKSASSAASSGGGCSVSFFPPIGILLLVPLLLRRK